MGIPSFLPCEGTKKNTKRKRLNHYLTRERELTYLEGKNEVKEWSISFNISAKENKRRFIPSLRRKRKRKNIKENRGPRPHYTTQKTKRKKGTVTAPT